MNASQDQTEIVSHAAQHKKASLKGALICGAVVYLIWLVVLGLMGWNVIG